MIGDLHGLHGHADALRPQSPQLDEICNTAETRADVLSFLATAQAEILSLGVRRLALFGSVQRNAGAPGQRRGCTCRVPVRREDLRSLPRVRGPAGATLRSPR